MPAPRTEGQFKAPRDVDTFSAKQRNVKLGRLAATTVVTHGNYPTTAPYAMEHWDDMIPVDPTAGTVGLTLPQTPVIGQVHEVWNVANNATAIVVTSGALAANISGPGITAGVSQSVATEYGLMRFTFMGSYGWLLEKKTS